MSNYNTGNPVPSADPRDLDDNATNFDLLLLSTAASVPDRRGVLRKTWHQMEQNADALVSPNVSSLSALILSANKGLYATGAGTLTTYDLSALGRTLGGIADAAAGRTALSAAESGENTDITSITGSAASLTTTRSIAATGDATWTVNFNGAANATGAITLAATGVAAGTYGSVTVNAKGLVTAASTATPVANGGTGQTTIAAAALAIAVPKLAWTTYTPTVSATTGTFTAASANGRYMVAFGVCHVQIAVTVTTKGTGAYPIVSLPFAALSGSLNYPLLAREKSVNNKSGSAYINVSLTTLTITDYAAAELATADGAIIYINGSYPVA